MKLVNLYLSFFALSCCFYRSLAAVECSVAYDEVKECLKLNPSCSPNDLASCDGCSAEYQKTVGCTGPEPTQAPVLFVGPCFIYERMAKNCAAENECAGSCIQRSADCCYDAKNCPACVSEFTAYGQCENFDLKEDGCVNYLTCSTCSGSGSVGGSDGPGGYGSVTGGNGGDGDVEDKTPPSSAIFHRLSAFALLFSIAVTYV